MLQWKRGIPTKEECRECWIVTGSNEDVPTSFGVVYAPAELKPSDYNKVDKQWYIALRIAPVAPPKPKTKTVIQWKWITKQGEELWTHLLAPSDAWIHTNESRKVEVPCD